MSSTERASRSDDEGASGDKSEGGGKKPLVLRDRLQAHFKEYGKLAIIIYLSMGMMTLIGFYFAIKAGVDIGSSSGQASAMVAAWVATKLTVPIRIGATLVLTPIIARLLGQWR